MTDRVVGIIGAMNEEIAALLDRMDDVETETVQSITYHLGTIGDTSVVVCKSEIGRAHV